MDARVTLTIAAPVARVWQALTDPAIVTEWAQVEPVDIPAGYPAAGQHATWLDNGETLHDEIVTVVPERQLSSRLALGPARVDETYLLEALDEQQTVLNATWSGDPALAINDASMARLKEWCER